MKKSKTKKLYFNKWTHKISCKVSGASRVRYLDLAEFEKMCLLDDSPTIEINPRYSFYSRRKQIVNKDELLKFGRAVNQFMHSPDSIQIRAENSHFNLFCKDYDVFDNIVSALEPWIKETHSPETEEDYCLLLSDRKIVLCNSFPHEKFKYKVVFKPYFEDTIKEQINTFIKNQNAEEYKVSKATQRWLDLNIHYTQDPFVYFTDNKILTFLMLICGDRIKKVEEFVVRN